MIVVFVFRQTELYALEVMRLKSFVVWSVVVVVAVKVASQRSYLSEVCPMNLLATRLKTSPVKTSPNHLKAIRPIHLDSMNRHSMKTQPSFDSH